MIKTVTTGFTSDERISIPDTAPFDSALALGQATAPQVRHALSGMASMAPAEADAVRQAAVAGRATLLRLSGGTCTVEGTDYAARYVARMDGFARGAGISPTDAALLQAELMPCCQTIMVGITPSHIGVLHTEENVDDDDLPYLHRELETGFRPPMEEPPHGLPQYRYRVVETSVDGVRQVFFAYPGICAGGSTVGINDAGGIIMCVDALGPVVAVPPDALWANAVAAMLFDAGSIPRMQALVSRIAALRLPFFGGYAIHVADTAGRMFSVEFGGRIMAVVPPETGPDGRRMLSQTNYPRLSSLQRYDKYAPDPPGGAPRDTRAVHLGLSARGRADRLQRIARAVGLVAGHPEDMLVRLDRTVADPGGDYEFSRGGWYVSNGFVTPYLAAYAVGAVTPAGTELKLTKLAPRQEPDRPYHRWIAAGEPLPDGSRDLWAEARRQTGKD